MMERWLMFLPVIQIFSLFEVHSQEPADTAMNLPPVNITSKYISNTVAGKKTDVIDSLRIEMNPSSTLSDLLQMHAAAIVKSYGPGSLSTLSLRGTSATHTDISWHGITLNQVSSGSIDFSLIPSQLFSGMSINRNGYNEDNYRPAVGGVVTLDNRNNYYPHNNILTSLTTGSHGLLSHFTRVNAGNSFIRTSTSIYFQENKNNYTYTDYSGKEKNLENAMVTGSGFMQDIYLDLERSGKFSYSVWYQDNQREVPGSMISNPGTSERFDKSLRSVMEWEKTGGNYTIMARQAYIIDWFRYSDIYIPSSLINSKVYLSTLQLTKKISKNFRLNSGLSNEFSKATGNNYEMNRDRNISSLYASFTGQMFEGRLNTSTIARIETDFIHDPVMLYSAGLTGKILPKLQSRISFTRTIHQPSFNDLYWVPGGNPGLKPEKAVSAETGLDYYIHGKTGKFTSVLSATMFSSSISDWIQWIPGEGFWSPENVTRVWSRGIESSCNIDIKFNSHSLALKIGYSYILSTNEESTMANDEALNKQLIYLPNHKATVQTDLQLKKWIFSAGSQFTGKSYVSSDNKYFLPDYFIMDLTINREIIDKKIKLNLLAGISNLFNEKYQVVQHYPMPGREFRLTLMCKLLN